MEAKLAKTYYSPGGYWRGLGAIKKLASAAKVPEDVAKKWLVRQNLSSPTAVHSSPQI